MAKPNSLYGALIILCWASAVQAQAPSGFLVEMNSVPGGVLVIRGDESKPAKLWQVLFAGDEVAIRDPLALVRIETSHGLVTLKCSTDAINGTDCRRYKIPADQMPWHEKLVAIVAGIFAAPARPSEVTAIGRGEGPRLAGDPRSRTVLSGNRSLMLLAYGSGNIRITIRQGQVDFGPYETSQVSSADCLSKPCSIYTGAIPLHEGEAQVEISDADGTAFQNLTIASSAPYPPSLKSTTSFSDFERMLWAAWLAIHPSGQWSLEAIQQLAPIQRDYVPAARLIEALSTQQVRD